MHVQATPSMGSINCCTMGQSIIRFAINLRAGLDATLLSWFLRDFGLGIKVPMALKKIFHAKWKGCLSIDPHMFSLTFHNFLEECKYETKTSTFMVA